MKETCFYCDDHLHDNRLHYVSFFHNAVEREETLCDVCYAEWLEGIKE